MDYSKIYDSLIEHRQTHPIVSGYTENHHILPVSLGGSDKPSNLVRLTAREHYIAHLLLHRFRKCSKTAYALWMMQCKSSTHECRPHIKSSRMYEWARKEFAKYVSRNNRVAAKGERNSQFGTRWISNIESRESKRISKDSEIPEGWIAGRNKWNFRPPLSPDELRKSRSERLIKLNISRTGHRDSPEARLKKSQQALSSGRNSGKNNPMFGRRYKRASNVKEA